MGLVVTRLSDEKRERACQMIRDGSTYREISLALNVTSRTIARLRRDLGVAPPRATPRLKPAPVQNANSSALRTWGGAIPSERLQPIIDYYRTRNGDVMLLSETAQRGICRVRDQEYVSLHLADRLLTEMGLTHFWRTELADLYELKEAA